MTEPTVAIQIRLTAQQHERFALRGRRRGRSPEAEVEHVLTKVLTVTDRRRSARSQLHHFTEGEDMLLLAMHFSGASAGRIAIATGLNQEDVSTRLAALRSRCSPRKRAS